MRSEITIHALEMDALRTQWNVCTKCEIGCRAFKHVHTDRIHPTNDDGYFDYSDTDILMIGEGPGKSEDVIGTPFVGVAGRLLRDVINEAGHGSTDVNITLANLVACRPADAVGADNRPPTNSEMANCRPRLEEIARICNPYVILALGNVAREQLQLYFPQWDVYHVRHPSNIARLGGKDWTYYPEYVHRFKDIFRQVKHMKEDDLTR